MIPSSATNLVNAQASTQPDDEVNEGPRSEVVGMGLDDVGDVRERAGQVLADRRDGGGPVVRLNRGDNIGMLFQDAVDLAGIGQVKTAQPVDLSGAGFDEVPEIGPTRRLAKRKWNCLSRRENWPMSPSSLARAWSARAGRDRLAPGLSSSVTMRRRRSS